MQGLALLVRMSTVSHHRQADNIKNDQEGMCCFRLQEVSLSRVDFAKDTSLGHLTFQNVTNNWIVEVIICINEVTVISESTVEGRYPPLM